MKFLIYIFLLLIPISYSIGQGLSGFELLKKSIEYHDPEGNWARFNESFSIVSSTPNKKDRTRVVYLNNSKGLFTMTSGIEPVVFYSISPEGIQVLLDGRSDISEEDKKKYRADEKGASMFRNYMTFLYGLPMKLLYPGTIIHSEVVDTVFFNIPSLRLKVTYEPKVGKDIWYFYFDKNDYSLKAYQFYHNESKNDGEYILLEKEAVFQNIRMPAVRTWYYNKDDKYLGTDTLKKSS